MTKAIIKKHGFDTDIGEESRNRSKTKFVPVSKIGGEVVHTSVLQQGFLKEHTVETESHFRSKLQVLGFT